MPLKRLLCSPVLLVLLAACSMEPVQAQVVYGSIFGTVTDPSGAPVPNAKVIITNTATGTRTEVVTNEDGNFRRGQLIAGPYDVAVEATGFSRTVVPGNQVSVDVGTRVDVRLTLGEVTTTLEVTAQAPLLRSDRAEVATQFTTQQLVELPNLDRNFQSFQILTPGAARLGWQHASAENPQGSVQIQINGQHFSSVDYQLDGTSNQDPILGIIVINPTIESVTETKITTSNMDAEFALAAAGVQVITTKSGTNDLHGALFHFNRTNTRGWQTYAINQFNNAEVQNGPPPVHWNQFGGAIGGPAIRNKLFFFGDAQITRQRLAGSVLTQVPTPLARTGDLSEYLEPLTGTPVMVQTTAGRMVPLQRNMIFDPLTGNPATGVGRQVFETDGILNKIPANRISPQARRILEYFPQPNTRDPGGSAFRRNYAQTGSGIIDSEQWNTRADWFINDRSFLFGRWSQAGYIRSAAGAFGDLAGGPNFSEVDFAGTSDVQNQSLAIGYNRTISPTFITEFRFGYMRYKVNVLPGGLGTAPAQEAGIPGLNLDQFFTSGMPFFDIEGPGDDQRVRLGYSLDVNRCNCPLDQNEKQFQWVSNNTLVRGNHSVKFGADMRHARNLRVPSDRHRSGQLRFSPQYVGYVPDPGANPQQGLGLGTFLLGQVTGFDRYVGTATDAAERQNRFFLYGQDTWRVTPKLQLNLGLRWEMIFPETVNAPGNASQPDLNTGEMAVYGIGGVPMHGLQEMKWTNFAPRLGVTYQLTDRTVLRAGYGWSYALGTFGSIFGHNVTQNYPVLAVQEVNRPNAFSGVFQLAQGPQQPTFAEPNPQTGRFLLPNGISVRSRPHNVRLPRTMQYNLTIQRQFFRDFAIEAGYVGNVGRHVFTGEGPDFNINEPAFIPGVPDQNIRRPFFQRFGWTQGINHYCNCANNRYDGLQIRADKRFSAGLGFTINYTWQKVQGYTDNWAFLYDRELSWGDRENFPNHTLSVPLNWDLPFGRGRRWEAGSAFVNHVFGGWSIQGVTYWRSGRPVNPEIRDFPAGTLRPDVGPNNQPDPGPADPYEGARTRERWFNNSIGTNGAFQIPSNNTFGTYRRWSLRGPQMFNQDLALHKTFRITEGSGLTLRGEAFNAFNNVPLGDPNNNMSSPEAGRITGLAPGGQMRRLQLGARLYW